MLAVAAIAVGALLGFAGSRLLRRPARAVAAPAAAAARPVARARKGKGLTAPELQRACYAAMVRHARSGVLPARYLLRLHPDDLATVDEARGWFVDGLGEALDEAAADKGWTRDGPLDVRFEADPAVRPGAPVALAVEPAATKASKAAAAEQAARRPPQTALVLRRTDTGEVFPLGDDLITIGRSTDRTVLIDDKRVSRGHADVRRGRAGWTLTDRGSSNGTSLNGRLLSPNAPAPLSAGDTIGVGPVELVVERGPR